MILTTLLAAVLVPVALAVRTILRPDHFVYLVNGTVASVTLRVGGEVMEHVAAGRIALVEIRGAPKEFEVVSERADSPLHLDAPERCVWVLTLSTRLQASRDCLAYSDGGYLPSFGKPLAPGLVHVADVTEPCEWSDPDDPAPESLQVPCGKTTESRAALRVSPVAR